MACGEERLNRRELIEEAVERWNLKEPEEIAAFAGITIEEAKDIIRESSLLKRQIDTRTPCKMCKKEPAQVGSDFCLQCRMMLNHAFGLAASDMAERAEEASAQQRSPLSNTKYRDVFSALEQKRNHAPGARRFTPKGRYTP
jgi:hypothetical protein